MRLFATDGPITVCMSVTRLRCAKTAFKIEVMFEEETVGDPRRIV